MGNNKDFKEENGNKNMGKGYQSYLEAAANRKRDEMTLYDPMKGLYYNVKIYPKPRKGFGDIGSIW